MRQVEKDMKQAKNNMEMVLEKQAVVLKKQDLTVTMLEVAKDKFVKLQVETEEAEKKLAELKVESEEKLAELKSESEKKLFDLKTESEKKLAELKTESKETDQGVKKHLLVIAEAFDKLSIGDNDGFQKVRISNPYPQAVPSYTDTC